jgi:hypothetical protein
LEADATRKSVLRSWSALNILHSDNVDRISRFDLTVHISLCEQHVSRISVVNVLN